jgi:5'(3')-deoxyribonucleotidase
MKTCVVIINIGNLNYADFSIRMNKEYYSHFGIDLHILTTHHPETLNTSPCWIKSLIFDLYPNYDFILCQDLDIIPVSLKFNIFNFLKLDSLNFSTDCTRLNVSSYFNDNDRFFRWNAGLFGYSKIDKNFFREIFNYGIQDPDGTNLYDQYYINDFIYQTDRIVNEIPIRFNTFFNPDIDYNKVSFVHYTNYMGSHDKLSFIEKYHPKELLNVHT